MGEKLIEPKFNVNEKYRQVNILNPYRFGGTPPSGDYDADAQAFIDAVATLSVAQEVAIDDLVVGLKANLTWSKYKAIYPFIGGTASSHKWNLKNPLDTDGAFRIIWSGTNTHSASGVKSDGTSGEGNTHLVPSVDYTSILDSHLSFYSTDNDFDDNFGVNMGCEDQSADFMFAIKFNGNKVTRFEGGTIGSQSDVTADRIGYFVATRTNANSRLNFYKDGVSIYDVSFTGGDGLNSNPVRLFRKGTGERTNNNCAFATIGLGLTTADASADNILIQAYQEALGRKNI